MFTPRYTITDRLLGNIRRVYELVTLLNTKRFPKPVLLELSRRARDISVFASTSIEGNPLPLTDVKRILKHHPDHIRDSEKEVLNYNKALLNLESFLRNSEARLTIDLLLSLQQTVTEGLVSTVHSGKFRKEPVFVNDPRTAKTIYLPPDHSDVPTLIRELFSFVKKMESQVDPLIVAGILHKQLVLIHPFIDGNGRTARLATKTLLARMGLDTFNLFSFENYYNNNVSRYFQYVGEYGNYYEIFDALSFTSWLEYFTEGIIDELLRVSKELQTEFVTPDTVLEDWHKEILRYIDKKGFITDRDYARLTDRSRPTRHLDFRKLIDLGLIELRGKGKASFYQRKNF